MHRLLQPSGVLFVHLDWRAAHYAKVLLDDIFGAGNFLNVIIWSYRTGGVSRRWFARKHDTILAYAKKRGRHTFHVIRDGTFRTDGLKRDTTGRPYKSTRKGRLYFDRRGPVVTDVWEIPFLSTVSLERVGYPSQKPLALLERIVAAASNPGDLVADFFCGSGTTLVAARNLGRRWLGCDSSPRAVEIARTRLAGPA
jgi:site-specific DNA-methyltransferase (adenine-specific)